MTTVCTGGLPVIRTRFGSLPHLKGYNTCGNCNNRVTSEHGHRGQNFTSIPQSIYWAIVTITTVGYGDIAPATVLGKILASVAMLTGYSIIAVPTGIITLEIGKAARSGRDNRQASCVQCGHAPHDTDASFRQIPCR